MLTFKFDFTEDKRPDQGVIQFFEGRNLTYEHREVKTPGEYNELGDSYMLLGRDVLKTLENKDTPQAHFTILKWWGDNGVYHEAILHGGTCYVMNEKGKTIDIIS